MEKPQILIVDDSDLILYKLKAILLRLGYTVTAYNNPLKALEWLQSTSSFPDLVISDVNMPDMDGYHLIPIVRALPSGARLPIILLTSATEVADRVAGLEAGADDYVNKTVNPTELDLRIKALLARKQNEEPGFAQSAAKTIALFSLRGGVGTSSLAVNLAIALSQLQGIEVCLWDMALSGGHCALMLNLKPVNTLSSLADWKESSLDDAVIADMFLKHPSGVKLLPAPLTPTEGELVTSATVDMVLPYLQGSAAYLVIDAGSHFNDPVLTILERSDLVLLVLAPELASVRSAYHAMQVFKELGFDLNKIMPVVNHIFPSRALPVKKIAEALRCEIAAEIPCDSGGFVEAINTGSPYILIAPRSEASQALTALAHKLGLGGKF